MIYVRDKGRLCNNILQYGHLYAWGREHGRETMSMRFAYKYRWFRICHTRHHHLLRYLWAKYGAKWGLLPVVSFDTDGADYSGEEALMLQRSQIVAEGWYARWYDLFLKYKSEIITLFEFDDRVQRVARQRLSALPGGAVRLGLHVRRGDYQTWHGGRYCFTDGQYISILRQFLALHQGETVQFIICGNDPSLDEQAYRQAFPDRSILFPKGNPAEDLCMLSLCDWLIGPPSTFTLVAAMYRDLPLCWIENAESPLTPECFSRFDELFRQIR